MKKNSVLILSQIVFTQHSPSKYEVEILINPNKDGKDTCQITAVIIFDKDSIIFFSRRKNKVLKEFRYSEIKQVEHSYSKSPLSDSN